LKDCGKFFCTEQVSIALESQTLQTFGDDLFWVDTLAAWPYSDDAVKDKLLKKYPLFGPRTEWNSGFKESRE
jgi:hypothetical protein